MLQHTIFQRHVSKLISFFTHLSTPYYTSSYTTPFLFKKNNFLSPLFSLSLSSLSLLPSRHHGAEKHHLSAVPLQEGRCSLRYRGDTSPQPLPLRMLLLSVTRKSHKHHIHNCFISISAKQQASIIEKQKNLLISIMLQLLLKFRRPVLRWQWNSFYNNVFK